MALTAIQEQQAKADKEFLALKGKVKAGVNGDILDDLEGIGRNHREAQSILANFNIPTLQAPNPGTSEKA